MSEPAVEMAAWEEKRRKAQESLAISQERYLLATKAGRVGVWDWNIVTGDFYLDPIIKGFLGYEDEEIPNDLEVWVNYVHPEDREPVMEAAQDCLDGKTPEYTCEHRMLHKDGSVRWVDVHGKTIRDEGGKAVRMVGTDTDVTVRKGVEEDRERLIAELQEALNNVRTLRGLLPICAHCKKIRDDRNYWKEVESYVEDHTHARFTHGICPDCSKKLYGEF